MKYIINRYTLISLLIFLSACKVSKDVATPQTNLPATWRYSTSEDSTTIADLSWKEFFTDKSLQNLVDSAITKNFDMQVALKNIESARLSLGQSKYAYWPSETLGVGASTNNPSNNSLNGLSLGQFLGSSHVEDYSANIALSWEADIWKKIRSQQDAALAGYLKTAEAKKALQTTIVAAVSQGFYNLVMLDEQLAIAEKNLLLSDSTVRIIRLQFEAGEVTALGVQQAEAQQLATAQLLPQLKQEISLQENALNILAGDYPAKIIRSQKFDAIPVVANLAAGVPSLLVSRRPDVKVQELDLQMANAKTGIAKANMYPSLVISATGGLNAFKASNWFNIPASLFGVVAGGITQPLFQRKQLRTQYELAKVDREVTVIRFRQSVLNAVGEVSDALVRIEQLQAQQTIASQRVSTLQNAISNAGQLFKNGMANYLEVITAQSNLLQSELALVSLKRAQLNANVELYRSLGGGWK